MVTGKLRVFPGRPWKSSVAPARAERTSALARRSSRPPAPRRCGGDPMGRGAGRDAGRQLRDRMVRSAPVSSRRVAGLPSSSTGTRHAWAEGGRRMGAAATAARRAEERGAAGDGAHAVELMDGGELRKQFFFEKKNQKTFARLSPVSPRQPCKKFLFLFSKRSACLGLLHRCQYGVRITGNTLVVRINAREGGLRCGCYRNGLAARVDWHAVEAQHV